jgi:hypothetical protein
MINLSPLFQSIRAVASSLHKDDHGIPGQPFSGNGGLISDDTRKAIAVLLAQTGRMEKQIEDGDLKK